MNRAPFERELSILPEDGPPIAAASWPPAPGSAPPLAPQVDEVVFDEGATLVLSRFGAGAQPVFEYEETCDVVGIGFHLKGGAEFQMEGAHFRTRPFEVWAGVAPRGSRSHFAFGDGGFETVSLRLAPELAALGGIAGRRLPRQLAAIAKRSQARSAVVRIGSLSQAATLVVRAMLAAPREDRGRALFLESCLHALLSAIGDEPERVEPVTANSLGRGKLDQAREHLECHHADPPTIAALARIVGTNEFTLKRAFKQEFGATIHGYVRAYRMDRAASRLDQGASVQDAAAAVGYQCPRSFAEAFRRNFGVLPSAMARRNFAPARHASFSR